MSRCHEMVKKMLEMHFFFQSGLFLLIFFFPKYGSKVPFSWKPPKHSETELVTPSSLLTRHCTFLCIIHAYHVVL